MNQKQTTLARFAQEWRGYDASSKRLGIRICAIFVLFEFVVPYLLWQGSQHRLEARADRIEMLQDRRAPESRASIKRRLRAEYRISLLEKRHDYLVIGYWMAVVAILTEQQRRAKARGTMAS